MEKSVCDVLNSLSGVNVSTRAEEMIMRYEIDEIEDDSNTDFLLQLTQKVEAERKENLFGGSFGKTNR